MQSRRYAKLLAVLKVLWTIIGLFVGNYRRDTEHVLAHPPTPSPIRPFVTILLHFRQKAVDRKIRFSRLNLCMFELTMFLILVLDIADLPKCNAFSTTNFNHLRCNSDCTH